VARTWKRRKREKVQKREMKGKWSKGDPAAQTDPKGEISKRKSRHRDDGVFTGKSQRSGRMKIGGDWASGLTQMGKGQPGLFELRKTKRALGEKSPEKVEPERGKGRILECSQ